MAECIGAETFKAVVSLLLAVALAASVVGAVIAVYVCGVIEARWLKRLDKGGRLPGGSWLEYPEPREPAMSAEDRASMSERERAYQGVPHGR